LIGLASNGLHTNGYSLAESFIKKYGLNKYVPELKTTLAKELLKVHRSYLKVIQGLTARFKNSFHFTHNRRRDLRQHKRVVPAKLKIKINWDSWKPNPVFSLIQKTGKNIRLRNEKSL
jgi:phosphoribosylformylglycinamidine cyclo-ligase